MAAGRMDEAREAAADYRARFLGQPPVSDHINPRNRPFKDPSIEPRLMADLARVGIE